MRGWDCEVGALATSVAVEEVRERTLGAREVVVEGGNCELARRWCRSEEVEGRDMMGRAREDLGSRWERCSRDARYAKADNSRKNRELVRV